MRCSYNLNYMTLMFGTSLLLANIFPSQTMVEDLEVMSSKKMLVFLRGWLLIRVPELLGIVMIIDKSTSV